MSAVGIPFLPRVTTGSRQAEVGEDVNNVLLIVVGVPAAVWLMADPSLIKDSLAWIESHDVLWKLGAFIAIQPLMFLFWKWLERFAGPYTIEREGASGDWVRIASVDTLKQAKGLAHDAHRRVLNLRGKVVYRGRLNRSMKGA